MKTNVLFYLKIRNVFIIYFTIISDEIKESSKKEDERNNVKNHTSTRLVFVLLRNNAKSRKSLVTVVFALRCHIGVYGQKLLYKNFSLEKHRNFIFCNSFYVDNFNCSVLSTHLKFLSLSFSEPTSSVAWGDTSPPLNRHIGMGVTPSFSNIGNTTSRAIDIELSTTNNNNSDDAALFIMAGNNNRVSGVESYNMPALIPPPSLAGIDDINRSGMALLPNHPHSQQLGRNLSTWS